MSSAYLKLLALETSTERLSLAVLHGESMFARDVDAGQRHSELTIPLLHELFAESGLKLADMDAIAFGQGPGSFTGVRIACGLTQGMALGAGKPVVPVPTQMALAEQCRHASGTDRVLVALDARMNEIYFAAYSWTADGWQAAVAPMLVKPDQLPPLGDEGERWQGIGSAFEADVLAAALSARYGDAIAGITRGALPSARDVVTIAVRQIERRGIASALPASQAAPLYLRNKVAMTIEERRQHHAMKEKSA
jgi:tRNA threonylcarbamoyladenosine biosynthesis protein TsaB